MKKSDNPSCTEDWDELEVFTISTRIFFSESLKKESNGKNEISNHMGLCVVIWVIQAQMANPLTFDYVTSKPVFFFVWMKIGKESAAVVPQIKLDYIIFSCFSTQVCTSGRVCSGTRIRMKEWTLASHLQVKSGCSTVRFNFIKSSPLFFLNSLCLKWS